MEILSGERTVTDIQSHTYIATVTSAVQCTGSLYNTQDRGGKGKGGVWREG